MFAYVTVRVFAKSGGFVCFMLVTCKLTHMYIKSHDYHIIFYKVLRKIVSKQNFQDLTKK